MYLMVIQMYGEHCDICRHYIPEHIKPVDDKDGKPMDVCGLCLQSLVADGLVDDDGYLKFSKEEMARECIPHKVA
jgi:hypothetical protein